MSVRVGINGFGRIGRNFFRAARKRGDDVEAVDGGIRAGDVELSLLNERDPAALPWKDLGVEVVLESTGLFTKRDDAQKHLEAGAEKVVISAPATDPDVTIVLGVNDDAYDKEQHRIIS